MHIEIFKRAYAQHITCIKIQPQKLNIMKLKHLVIRGIGVVICTFGFATSALAQDKTTNNNTSSTSTTKTTTETGDATKTTTKKKTVSSKESASGDKKVKETKTDTKVETDKK